MSYFHSVLERRKFGIFWAVFLVSTVNPMIFILYLLKYSVHTSNSRELFPHEPSFSNLASDSVGEATPRPPFDPLPQQNEIVSNISSTHSINDFTQGELLVDPILPRRCVSIRFRGDSLLYSIDEAIDLLRSMHATIPRPQSLRIGVMMMEEVLKFFPVRIRETGNNYHLYHFIEFLVMAYAELTHLGTAFPVTMWVPIIGQHDQRRSSLSRGNPSISIPWIFSPYMSPSEICGGPSSLNCLAADLTLRAANYSIFQSKTGIVGLEPMEHYKFNHTNHKDKAVQYRVHMVDDLQYFDYRFTEETDCVLIIERFGCNMAGINKPWSKYIDTFPATKWHADIMQGLGMEDSYPSEKRKLVIGYVDRQNTDRHIPQQHHDWLIQFMSHHEQVEFLQLHMEDYSAIEQIKTAARCNVLIGMHGNGLTHLLWMRPGSYVIEIFWKYNFQFDYATAAQLMNHTYLGLQNGQVLDREMVARRDPKLRKQLTRKEAQHASVAKSMLDFEQQGKPAIQKLIETAIHRLIQPHELKTY